MANWCKSEVGHVVYCCKFSSFFFFLVVFCWFLKHSSIPFFTVVEWMDSFGYLSGMAWEIGFVPHSMDWKIFQIIRFCEFCSGNSRPLTFFQIVIMTFKIFQLLEKVPLLIFSLVWPEILPFWIQYFISIFRSLQKEYICPKRFVKNL